MIDLNTKTQLLTKLNKQLPTCWDENGNWIGWYPTEEPKYPKKSPTIRKPSKYAEFEKPYVPPVKVVPVRHILDSPIVSFLTEIKDHISHCASFLKDNDLHRHPRTGAYPMYWDTSRQRKTYISPEYLINLMGLKVVGKGRDGYVPDNVGNDRKADAWIRVNYLFKSKVETHYTKKGKCFPVVSYDMTGYLTTKKIKKWAKYAKDRGFVSFEPNYWAKRNFYTAIPRLTRFVIDIDPTGNNAISYEDMVAKCERLNLHPWIIVQTNSEGGYHLVFQGDNMFESKLNRLFIACLLTDTDPSDFISIVDMKDDSILAVKINILMEYLYTNFGIDRNLLHPISNHVARIPGTYNYDRSFLCVGGFFDKEYIWSVSKLSVLIQPFYTAKALASETVSQETEIEIVKEKEAESFLYLIPEQEEEETEEILEEISSVEAAEVIEEETVLAATIEEEAISEPEAEKVKTKRHLTLVKPENTDADAIPPVSIVDAVEQAKQPVNLDYLFKTYVSLSEIGKQAMVRYASPSNVMRLKRALDTPELKELKAVLDLLCPFLCTGLGWLRQEVPTFGISQLRLAKILGRTQPTISRYLRLLVRHGYLIRSEGFVAHEQAYEYCLGDKLRKLFPLNAAKKTLQEYLQEKYEIGNSNEGLMRDVRICYLMDMSQQDIENFIYSKYMEYVKEKKPYHKRSFTSLKGIVANWVKRKKAG